MAVRFGHLDPLLGQTINANGFVALSYQAATTTGSLPTATIGTLTATIGADPYATATSVKVTAIDDNLNTLTAIVYAGSTQVAQITEYLIGFGVNGNLLLSPSSSTSLAASVNTGHTLGNILEASASDLADSAGATVFFTGSSPNGNPPISASAAVSQYNGGTISPGTVVSDYAAQIQANLDGLKPAVAVADITDISLLDSGTPYLALTAAQLTSDAVVLHDIITPYALWISASAANVSITGLDSEDIVAFQANAGAYSIAQVGAGPAFTVTDVSTGRTSVDHLSKIEFLQFADRMEFVATPAEAQIALLYQGTLGRTPDVPGLVGWQNAFATEPLSAQQADNFTALAGTPVAGLPDLAYGFTTSTEFQQKYGALTDTQFVTQLYANVLDRAPDSAGLNGWVSALGNGHGHTREWVVVGFVESPEAYHNAEVGYVGQSGTHAPWLTVV